MPNPINYQEIWANLPDWMRTADGQYNDYNVNDLGSIGKAYTDFLWWLQNTQGGQQYASQNPYWQQQLSNPYSIPPPGGDVPGPGNGDVPGPGDDPPGGPPPPTDPYKNPNNVGMGGTRSVTNRATRTGPGSSGSLAPPGMTPRVPPGPPTPGGGNTGGGGIGIWTGGNPPPATQPPPGSDPPQPGNDTAPGKLPPSTSPPVSSADQEREKAAALTASTTGPRVTTATGPRNPSAFVGHIKRLKGY